MMRVSNRTSKSVSASKYRLTLILIIVALTFTAILSGARGMVIYQRSFRQMDLIFTSIAMMTLRQESNLMNLRRISTLSGLNSALQVLFTLNLHMNQESLEE